MAQVFRIEIPVNVTDNSDKAALQQLEASLKKIFASMNSNKASVNQLFNAIEQGANEARAALQEAGTVADSTANSYDNVAQSATNAGSEQTAATEGAASAAEQLDNTVSGLSDAYTEAGNSATEAGRKSGSAFEQAASSADKFTQRMEKSNNTLRNMFKEKLKLTLAAIDRASPVLKSIWNSAKSLTQKAWRITVRMADFATAPFRKLLHMISSPITMALSIAGIGFGAGSVISTFTDFESGMSTVKALTGATDAEFAQLTSTAQTLGATTKFTATEASEGMKYLAMAGWETNQIIDAMPGLLNLAAAGATDLGTAADIVSDVMTAMGMAAGEAGTAADIFAKTATSTNTTIEGLGATMKYAAPIAHSFGMSLADVAAAAGLMANAGIKDTQAGTALRASLLRMASPTTEMAKTMSKLGLSFTTAGGKMKSMSTIISDLETAFAGLSEAEKLASAQEIFGTEAASAWLGLISQGSEAYKELLYNLEHSTGAAEQMAQTQLDNLKGDITLLQSAADGMWITLIGKLNPYMRQGVQWLTGKIPAITDALSGLIDKAVGLKEHLDGVFSSSEWQNADGFIEKAFVAWDKVVAEPFDEWWNGNGRAMINSAAEKIGGGLGDLYHGIIAGIFAAIKGEEIDFGDLNITGLARAGAEAAQSFVSAFMAELDLMGLIGDMPGMMKAGLFGYGALKIGQGGYGAYKTVTALKTALTGVSTSAQAAAPAVATVGVKAASSAISVGKATSVLGGLKVALSSIPVWGWVAAAAITTAAIGIKTYSDEQERQRQNLLKASEAGAEAAEQYRESAREYVAMSQALAEANGGSVEIDTSIKPISEVDRQSIIDTITELGTYQIELETTLKEGGLSETEQMKLAAQIMTIEANKVALSLSLKEPSEAEVEAVKQQIQMLEEQKIDIQAAIENGGLAPEDVAALQQQISDIELAQICLKAMIEPLSETEIQILKDKLAKIEEEKIAIQAKIDGGGLPPEEVSALEQEIDRLNQREVLIKASLGGLTDSEVAQYASQQLGIDYAQLVEMSGGVFTQADVDAGRITPEYYQTYLQQLEVEAQTKLLNFQTEVTSAREQVPQMVEMRDKYATAYEQETAKANTALSDKLFLAGLDAQRKNLIAQYNAGEIGTDELTKAGSQMLAAISQRFGEFGVINTASMTPDMLFGQREGGLFGFGGQFVAKDTDPFAAAMSELNARQTTADANAQTAQADYTAQNQALIQQYQNEKALIEGKTFQGSELAGMSLEEVAASYATLDEAGRRMFDDALNALTILNQQTDYIAESDKTQASEITAMAEGYVAQPTAAEANPVDTADLEAKTAAMQGIKSEIQSIAADYQSLTAEQQATFAASEAGVSCLEAVNSALESLGQDQIESLDQLNSALDILENIDLSSFSLDAVQSAFNTVAGEAAACKAQVDSLRSAISSLDGLTAETHVYNYTHNIVTGGGGKTGGQIKYYKNAYGGIYDGAFLSWVAEDGPEAIIPLGADKRNRGLDLWMQAGEALGIAEFADGGIVAPYSKALENLPVNLFDDDGDDDTPDPKPVYPIGKTGGGGVSGTFHVSVSANPTYRIEGTDSNIIEKIKGHQREVAEIVAQEISAQLEDIITNM